MFSVVRYVMMEVKDIKREMEMLLSEGRYLHCLRVADVASKLASTYHYDIAKAYVAGLVHDVSKELSDEENIRIVLQNNLDIALLDDSYRKMLHADIGAIVARERFGLDEEVCYAVASHAIGNVPMGLLDKIVFVADKIEPFKVYEGIDLERRMASVDLDKTLIMCIENRHKKLVRERKFIHPKSMMVLDYLKKDNRDVAC